MVSMTLRRFPAMVLAAGLPSRTKVSMTIAGRRAISSKSAGSFEGADALRICHQRDSVISSRLQTARAPQ